MKTIMVRDINDFITISRPKNGGFRFRLDVSNEAKIYQLLSEFGFRKIRIEKKWYFFRYDKGQPALVGFFSLMDAYVDFLKECEFQNLPNELVREDILNWFYKKSPIKQNALFDHHLVESPTEMELHRLRLIVDPDYEHQFISGQLLLKFEEWKFQKTTDKVGEFGPANPLYYKKIGANKYLVFNHYASKLKNKDGFDCRIATYAPRAIVGVNRPLDTELIQLNFNVYDDIEKIRMFQE